MKLSRFFCFLAFIGCIVFQVQSLVIASRDSAESDVYGNNRYQDVGERLKRQVDLANSEQSPSTSVDDGTDENDDPNEPIVMPGMNLRSEETENPSQYTLLEWLHLGHDKQSYKPNMGMQSPGYNGQGYVGSSGGIGAHKLFGIGGEVHLGFKKPGHEFHIGSTGGFEINKSGWIGSQQTGGYGNQGYGQVSHGTGMGGSAYNKVIGSGSTSLGSQSGGYIGGHTSGSVESHGSSGYQHGFVAGGSGQLDLGSHSHGLVGHGINSNVLGSQTSDNSGRQIGMISGSHHALNGAIGSSHNNGLNIGSQSGGWESHGSSNSEQGFATSSNNNHKFTGSGSNSYIPESSIQSGGQLSNGFGTEISGGSQHHIGIGGGNQFVSSGSNSHDSGFNIGLGAQAGGYISHGSGINKQQGGNSHQLGGSISNSLSHGSIIGLGTHSEGFETHQSDLSHHQIEVGSSSHAESSGSNLNSYGGNSNIGHGVQSGGFQIGEPGNSHHQITVGSSSYVKLDGAGPNSNVHQAADQSGGHRSTGLGPNQYDKPQYQFGNNGGSRQELNGQSSNSYGYGPSFDNGFQSHGPDNAHRIEVGSSSQAQLSGVGFNPNYHKSNDGFGRYEPSGSEKTQYNKPQNTVDINGGGGPHDFSGMNTGSYVHGPSATHGDQSSGFQIHQTGSEHQFEMGNNINQGTGRLNMNSQGLGGSIGLGVESGASQTHRPDNSQHRIEVGSSNQPQSIDAGMSSNSYPSTGNTQFDKPQNQFQVSGGGGRHEFSGMNTGSYVYGPSATHGDQSNGFPSHQTGSEHQFEMGNNINRGTGGLNMNSQGLGGSIGLGVESGASQTHRPDNSQHRIEVGSSNQPQSIDAGISSNRYPSSGNTQYDKPQNQFQVSGGGGRHEFSGMNTGSYVYGPSATHGDQSSGFPSHQTGSEHQFEMGNNINRGTGGLNMNSQGLGGSIGLGVESGASQIHRPDNSHHRIEVGSSNQPQSIGAGINSNSYPSTGNTQYDKPQNQFQVSGGGGRNELSGIDTGSHVHGSSGTHGAESSGFHSQGTSIDSSIGQGIPSSGFQPHEPSNILPESGVGKYKHHHRHHHSGPHKCGGHGKKSEQSEVHGHEYQESQDKFEVNGGNHYESSGSNVNNYERDSSNGYGTQSKGTQSVGPTGSQHRVEAGNNGGYDFNGSGSGPNGYGSGFGLGGHHSGGFDFHKPGGIDIRNTGGYSSQTSGPSNIDKSIGFEHEKSTESSSLNSGGIGSNTLGGWGLQTSGGSGTHNTIGLGIGKSGDFSSHNSGKVGFGGFESQTSGGLDIHKSTATDMRKSNEFGLHKSNEYELYNTGGFNTVNSLGFGAQKKSGFQTHQSSSLESHESNEFESHESVESGHHYTYQNGNRYT